MEMYMIAQAPCLLSQPLKEQSFWDGLRDGVNSLPIRGSFYWQTDSKKKIYMQPLFNTCNVMEVTDQQYGKVFRKDSLTMTFEIPGGVKNLRLPYVTTGHGGWGSGDEFNPKQNEIFFDGKRVFVYTPWRGGCAAYRKYNPVSGNFRNGLSSSDLSRSR